MILIIGPLFAGKSEYAQKVLGFEPGQIVKEAQELAHGEGDLEELARRLSENPVVLCTEIGGGVVPIDREERAFRERAGRLGVLLAQRADTVVRVWCGLPQVLKGELPCK